MDTGKLKERALEFYKKYKFVLLILVVGIIFMLLPSQTQEVTTDDVTQKVQLTDEDQLSNTLSQMLSKVEGAGEVSVLLTVSKGKQFIYQTNKDSDASTDTVTLTDAQRNETGLIQQVNSPIYQGAVVLCQGADDPQVRLAVTDAVSKVTGLGANQIAVIKMK